MYDVRGIQDYIFRTSKLKDAIGASAIIDNIFEDALKNAVSALDVNAQLNWYDSDGPLTYDDASEADVKVLYIGGGNACVVYKNRTLAEEISKRMAKYTLERTYSLQLATAIVDKTDNYGKDYAELMKEMVRVKDSMMVSKPLDALPVMKVEIKTGLPLTTGDLSTESDAKRTAGERVRSNIKHDQKLFDSYVNEKGESSMLAVVHIDGNNMGLRIRELISGFDSYSKAVNEMRKVSYNINMTYTGVFEDMVDTFRYIKEHAKRDAVRDMSKWWIMKVIDAGDDITYVCNAGIAFATVEYFCKKISEYSMKSDSDAFRFRFSACAGIAYFNSHFPFNIAYNVAEECCESAKSRAKEEAYTANAGKMVGNWVDFQFCRSVHARNLDRIREREYVTASGEELLRRPYYICSDALADAEERDTGAATFRDMDKSFISYTRFRKDLEKYVLGKNNVPRSFTKDMRNTYPLGREQMEILKSFLKSRDSREQARYPDDFYYMDKSGKRIATLYDALEIADYYCSFEELSKGSMHAEDANKNNGKEGIR